MTQDVNGHPTVNPGDNGWCIGEVSFAWDEDAPGMRSAPDLYTRLLGHPPAVVLSSRVPTALLPYLGYAAGDRDADYEVSVRGHDHAARVRLRRRGQDLSWDLVMGVTRDLDNDQHVPALLRRIEMELYCAAESGTAQRLVGSETYDKATVRRWYGDKRRQDLASPFSGELSLERLVTLDYDDDDDRQVRVRAVASVREASEGEVGTLSWAHILGHVLHTAQG